MTNDKQDLQLVRDLLADYIEHGTADEVIARIHKIIDALENLVKEVQGKQDEQ